MSALYLVLPLALLVVLAAVLAYLWAARHGQFDDLTTPALRALHEDDTVPPTPAGRPASRGAGSGAEPPGPNAPRG